MFPDLAGLSQEEAALITDVLSRLSIGSTPAASTVPQSTPAHGSLQDPTLMELDMAAWTLEQELRGLNSTPSLGSQHERFPREAYSHTNPPFQGSAAIRGSYLAAGFYGTPESPAVYAPDTPSGRWPQEPGTASQPATSRPPLVSSGQTSRVAPSFGVSQPSYQFEVSHAVASAAVEPDGVGAGAAPTQQGHQPQSVGIGAEPTGMSLEEPLSNGMNTPPSPAAPPSMSLLKEMREKLRQQQTQQLSSEGARDAGASRASSVSGTMSSVAGYPGPAAPQIGRDTRASSVSPGAASPSSGAVSRGRRAQSSAPSSMAKAFTMLNARTSVDRYGPDAAQAEAQASTPTKPPVKLPETERSARLQQLYERTAKWKQRCDERYAKERLDREASELEECTFTPKITRTSVLIMQGKSPSEVYNELSKGSTPTKHRQDLAAHDRQPSPCNATANSARTAPVRVAGGNRSPSVGSTPAGIRPYAAVGRATATAPGKAGSDGSSANGAAVAVSPPRLSVNGAQVGERLYQRASEFRARQEARYFQQLLEEERQRRFTASVQDVSPRVYNPPEPPTSRHLPTGMEECTFQPSSYSGFNRRPKSAPHMRGEEGRPPSLNSPLFNIYGPPGMSSRDNNMATRSQNRGRTSSVVSFSPDLDWEEFLSRQERFLVQREHKIQLLEQTEPPPRRMARGSIKLLREREARLSSMNPEGAGEAAEQGEASGQTGSSSPGPPDRRVRTIMEMYKECTFQPQITRRASAMPGRQLDDFVEGGRARREEWRQQQLALQQMREAEDLTFKPQTFTKDAYSHVRPRISLKNPDAYLAHVADKRKQRDALRAELDSEREALELQQCTFKPQTTPLPGYLIRRLQEQHLQQLQADGTGQSIAWEESSGGLGDIDAETAMRGSDDLYTDAAHEHPPVGFQPYQADQADRASADQATDALDAEESSYREAYQRALHFATSLGQASS